MLNQAIQCGKEHVSMCPVCRAIDVVYTNAIATGAPGHAVFTVKPCGQCLDLLDTYRQSSHVFIELSERKYRRLSPWCHYLGLHLLKREHALVKTLGRNQLKHGMTYITSSNARSVGLIPYGK